MILRKWDYERHTYDKIKVPKDWKCTVYCEDMDQVINCPQCGKKLKYGETYTSLEIHSVGGFGYAVCEKCYEKEWKRRKKYKND